MIQKLRYNFRIEKQHSMVQKSLVKFDVKFLIIFTANVIIQGKNYNKRVLDRCR